MVFVVRDAVHVDKRMRLFILCTLGKGVKLMISKRQLSNDLTLILLTLSIHLVVCHPITTISIVSTFLHDSYEILNRMLQNFKVILKNLASIRDIVTFHYSTTKSCWWPLSRNLCSVVCLQLANQYTGKVWKQEWKGIFQVFWKSLRNFINIYLS